MRRGALILIILSITAVSAGARSAGADPDTNAAADSGARSDKNADADSDARSDETADANKNAAADSDARSDEAAAADSGARSDKRKSGTFQISTALMSTTYSLFGGSGGPDRLRYSWFGISFKSTAGPLFRSLIDITVVIPFKIENQLYPAADFSNRDTDTALPPFGLDAVLGFAYQFNVSPMYLLVGTGLHVGLMFEQFRTLTAFGIALDTQIHIKMGRAFALQFGGKLNLDFGGVQNLTRAAKTFTGLSAGFGFYSGIGVSY